MKLLPQASQKLTRLARSIREREKVIETCQARLEKDAWEFLAEIFLQGKELLEAKALLPFGEWLPWLEKHFPKSERTAQVYMRIASKTKHAAELESAGSLRQAMVLLFPDQTPAAAGKDTPPRSWPPYIEAISRVSKCTGYIERFPLTTWPQEGREELKEKLEPVAKQLWPDKFL